MTAFIVSPSGAAYLLRYPIPDPSHYLACFGILSAQCGAPMSAAALVLHRERRASGLSQKDLAALCRISPQYMCDIEHGRRQFPEWIVTDLPHPIKAQVVGQLVAEHRAAIERLEASLAEPHYLACNAARMGERG